MPFITTIQDTAYTWMPRWFLVMMLVSSIGSAVLFLLTIRASGKKGYLFLAVAAALPSLLYVKTTVEEKIRQERAWSEVGRPAFHTVQGGPRPEIPWMSALTLIGAVMLYRSEKSRANQSIQGTPGKVPSPATEPETRRS